MPVSQQSAPSDLDDEISLIELWQILVERKILIVLVFVTCVIAGAAFAYLQPPVYHANAKLRIGQVAGDGLLESVEEPPVPI